MILEKASNFVNDSCNNNDNLFIRRKKTPKNEKTKKKIKENNVKEDKREDKKEDKNIMEKIEEKSKDENNNIDFFVNPIIKIKNMKIILC